ncbi:Ig-like domain-containing protein [Tannerella forsythia]|uniref:Ig-like domain-containing protein n=1 Tax=Tannerella forsythia TaxID=28112 RepID=UPI0028E31617|nr:Ig-like domain-containing protein [Tannerella forsythia]
MGKKAFYSTMFIAIFAMIFVRGAYAGIGISPTTMNLKVGETATLTVTPDTVTIGYGIKSLNRSIATVNPPDGVGTASFTVTAVAPGTTKIQVLRLISGSYVVTAECAVTVTEAQTEVWPQSATLSPARITLREGEEASIEAAVLPANYNQGTPQWSVENQNIASVTGSGLTATVKGLAVGTTTLHFTIGNANASCVITVTKAQTEVWPESATLSPARLTLKVGEQASVDATVRPDNYNQGSLKWSIDDERTANVTPNGLSATVEAVAAGTTTLHFTVGKVSASCTVTVSKAEEPKPDPKPEPLEPDDLGDIEIMPGSIVLNAGDRCQFRLQAEPEGVPLPTLQWSVTDGTSVVKILRAEDGSCWIDTLKPGGATLTVTTGDFKAEALISVK